MNGQRVLIVEKDQATRLFLADELAADGYEVHVCSDAAGAQQHLADGHFDVAIVDINGHTVDFLDAFAGRLAVLVLATGATVHEICRKLDRGADDVLAKPFSYPELRSRVAALIRRRQRGAHLPIVIGQVTIDPAARVVSVHGRTVELSRREYGLLRLLAEDPRRVYTKQELLGVLWPGQHVGMSRTLDSHACRLRLKLQQAGAGAIVVNVWGVGYRLLDGVAVTA